jgi:hypothetical protein
MKSKSQLLWLFPVIALIAAIAGAYWFVLRPDAADNTVAANQANGPKVPDLGGRGRPVELSNMEVPGDDGVETDGAATDGGEVEPEPEAANSAREIDIWLSNLAIATKASDRKGIALNHEMLAKAKPDVLVDERVRNGLDNEESAWVRIQFFAAYHEAKPRFDWAMHVYDTRTAKFMGTDDLYAGGEVEELKLVAKELFGALAAGWVKDESGDARLMALLRSVLDTEKPAWMLEQNIHWVLTGMAEAHMVSFARALEQEFRNLLQRRTADRGFREYVFIAFVLTFDPHTDVLAELELSEWWDYASALPSGYGKRPKPLLRAGLELGWVTEFFASPEIPKLFERLLQGSMPIDDKRLLIQRIAEFAVPNGRAMIEAGLLIKDANYPDYLTAFGSFAETGEELQRLTSAADEPDVAAAQGAIEGLRQSTLPEADVELRKVLEDGKNLGVKSQALGALLSRTENTDTLLDEYLDESKDASLRAVAAQHVPLTSVERLQRIVEEDPSPTVRLAALNRVGSIVPESVFQRKELRGWFLKIKDRDNSYVIRAAARKYADALELKEE